jgi:uncharacterized repeat protein (TIGR01451 family)
MSCRRFHIGAVIILSIACASSAVARDYFTESFNGDFDLSYSTFTFKPDHSSNGYAVCRSPATAFPTPPTDGFLIEIYPWSIPVGIGLPFFGQRYREVMLNPNGSVTYGENFPYDPGFDSTISNHFRLPRMSAWLGSLGDAQFGHPVHYRSLSNLIALTWIDRPDGTNGGSNSLQLELFYDGVIRLTFLRMDAAHGIVGLSPGGGVPADFAESNLSGVVCAGQALHELVWTTPPPPMVQAGVSFAASLAGRDAFNLGFPVNGPARLGSGRPGAVVFHTDFEQGAAGFTLTNVPSYESNAWHLSTYRGTQLGHSPSHSMYFGHADTTLTDSPAAAGRLVSPLIDLREVYPPVTLSFSHLLTGAGAQIEIREEGQSVTSVAALGGLHFPGDTAGQWVRSAVDLSFFAGRQVRVLFRGGVQGGSFHQNDGWLVDDITITGTTSSIPITPSVTGPFSGNSWSGNISVGGAGSGLVLIAAHSNGVYGLSAPFDVSANDDLSLSAVVNKTDMFVRNTNSIDILVSNTGPTAADSVVVTNQLPPGVTLGNVAVSQGAWSINGNHLLLDFGSIGGERFALAAFEFVPSTTGTLSFTSVVGRAGSEAFLENNRSINHVNVGESLIISVPTAFAKEDATNVIFNVQLDAASPRSVSVQFATLSGSATAGEDFVATNGLITFPPGATNAEVRVRIIDDNIFEVLTNEPPEYFVLQLSSATNAGIGTLLANGGILENEPLPVLIVSATNAVEGDVGTNTGAVVVQMSGVTAMPVDVHYETRSGADFDLERGFTLFGTATSSVDFAPVNDFFTFAPGETQRVINVPIIGDTTAEPNETFSLRFISSVLLPVYPARPRPPFSVLRQFTIIDGDPPVLSVDDYEIIAENCGTSNGALDPGETVTVLLRARNAGYNACTSSNLVATLLATGAVLNPSNPQNYGAMCGGAPEVWRPFAFTVGAMCGTNVIATLAFSDNGTNRGTSSLSIPVGQRGRSLAENFDSTTISNLPPGWAGGPYTDSPWYVTTDPAAPSNHFVHITFNHLPAGAAALSSSPFLVTSSNAWLKLRHRFEITPIGAGASVSFRAGGNYANASAVWDGSSRGWMTSLIPIPPSLMGTTQSVYFEFAVLNGPLPDTTWDIDSVEVFDGPITCCAASMPTITSARRTNSNIVLQWTSIANRTYQLQFKPSLAPTQTWMDTGPPILATSPMTSQTNTISASNGFYRVRLNP